MTRHDGRSADALRPIQVQLAPLRNPDGSVLYTCGGTTVLITASVEEGVRDFLRGTGQGWITAEYAMHPCANANRQRRESRTQLGGRTQEIQRLIGRSLRGAVVPERLGERTITIDCDVLNADGGTRTASITGGYIALVMALDKLRKAGRVTAGVLREPVAAISVGLVDGKALLDLNYVEDSAAQVDLNVVATTSGQIIEVQGTAEGAPMLRSELDKLVDLGLAAMPGLAQAQQQALETAGVDVGKLLKR